ncbi:MAG TPA: hypothetical protein VNU49_03050 [Opitutaceae bacterium]|nr:hypothetical protein [Opitutaceae bacterium]
MQKKPIMLRLVLVLFTMVLFSSCASNTLENPNLQAPIDPTKAEVVGSKIAGDGGIPYQIYASFVDGTQLRHVAVDQTLKIWPIEPGAHNFRVEFAGSTGKIFLHPYTAEGQIMAELKAAHRYVVKIRPSGKGKIIFYFEDTSDGREIATSDPVQLVDVEF